MIVSEVSTGLVEDANCPDKVEEPNHLSRCSKTSAFLCLLLSYITLSTTHKLLF